MKLFGDTGKKVHISHTDPIPEQIPKHRQDPLSAVPAAPASDVLEQEPAVPAAVPEPAPVPAAAEPESVSEPPAQMLTVEQLTARFREDAPETEAPVEEGTVFVPFSREDDASDDTLEPLTEKTDSLLPDDDEPPVLPAAAAGSAKTASGSGKSKRGLKKLYITLGCIVLALLIGIVIYAIWEKPPEVVPDGIRTPEPTVLPVPTDEPVIATETPAPTEKPVEETPEPTEEPEDPNAVKHLDNCYTILLLAYDQIGSSTDTILVGRMDTDAGTIDVINIPRDTLVDVTWGVKKLNTVLNGNKDDIDAFKSELAELIGFSIDNYAVVDMQAVSKLVDCIGGVDYYVPRNMDYDDPTQNLSIHISAGWHRLYGDDAVKVLRYREGNGGTGYADGDIGRIHTQQDFMMSLASQMLTLGNIPNLNKAINIFETYVRTDLDTENLAFFARNFLLMNKSNITFHTAPGDAISVRGGSYYQLNLDAWVELINSSLNPYNVEITAENLNVLRQTSAGIVSSNGKSVSIESFYDYSTYVAEQQEG